MKLLYNKWKGRGEQNNSRNGSEIEKMEVRGKKGKMLSWPMGGGGIFSRGSHCRMELGSCVITQYSTVLSYFTAEAWHHEQLTRFLLPNNAATQCTEVDCAVLNCHYNRLTTVLWTTLLTTEFHYIYDPLLNTITDVKLHCLLTTTVRKLSTHCTKLPFCYASAHNYIHISQRYVTWLKTWAFISMNRGNMMRS